MSAGLIISGIVFSGVGFVAFIYGRKQSLWKPMVIGATLMAIPYVLQNVWALWAAGLALIASLWIFRE